MYVYMYGIMCVYMYGIMCVYMYGIMYVYIYCMSTCTVCLHACYTLFVQGMV